MLQQSILGSTTLCLNVTTLPFCRADEDQPFTYSFDAIDVCTKKQQKLNNAIPTRSSITTKIRYDLAAPCKHRGDRLVMVVGTVTDRLGASADLCDRTFECPFIAFEDLPDMDPAEMIRDVRNKLANNQVTGMQAVDELTFAVQTRQLKRKKDGPAKDKGDTADEKIDSKAFTQKDEEEELVTVLTLVQDAAKDALGAETRQTPRVQGRRMLV